MSHKFLGVMAVCCVGAGLALAEEITSARVKALDFQKNTITVTVGDKDNIYPVHKDAKFFKVIKKKGEVGTETPLNSLTDVPLGEPQQADALEPWARRAHGSRHGGEHGADAVLGTLEPGLVVVRPRDAQLGADRRWERAEGEPPLQGQHGRERDVETERQGRRQDEAGQVAPDGGDLDGGHRVVHVGAEVGEGGRLRRRVDTEHLGHLLHLLVVGLLVLG